MTPISAIIVSLLSMGPGIRLAPAENETSKEIKAEELKAHVYRLASKEFAGRRGPGGARAARLIAGRFAKLKLKPAFGGSFFQRVKNFLREANPKDGKNFIGSNVGAVLLGADPKLKDEWILISAHFDHLGMRNGIMYPGADDNASAVAMLLEVAEKLALAKQQPRRTIVFVSFDLEEAGLLGSRYFALYPPRDLKKLKCFLTADMLGRSMANVMDEYVFLMGSETATRLGHLTNKVPTDKGLKIGRLGADIVGTRSDYGPFRDRKIPFLFFSTGQHPDYHTPNDLPDRVNYFKLQKISRWIAKLTWRLANDDESPVWNSKPKPNIQEVVTVRILLDRVLKRPKEFPLGKRQRGVIESIEKRLAAIEKRGQITSSERTWLIWTSRILLVTIF